MILKYLRKVIKMGVEEVVEEIVGEGVRIRGPGLFRHVCTVERQRPSLWSRIVRYVVAPICIGVATIGDPLSPEADAAGETVQLWGDVTYEESTPHHMTSDTLLRAKPFMDKDFRLGLEYETGRRLSSVAVDIPLVPRLSLRAIGNYDDVFYEKEGELRLHQQITPNLRATAAFLNVIKGDMGIGGLSYKKIDSQNREIDYGFDAGLTGFTHRRVQDFTTETELRADAWVHFPFDENRGLFAGFGKFDDKLKYGFSLTANKGPALRISGLEGVKKENNDFRMFQAIATTDSVLVHKYDSIKNLDDDAFDDDTFIRNNPFRYVVHQLDQRVFGPALLYHYKRPSKGTEIHTVETLTYPFKGEDWLRYCWIGAGYDNVSSPKGHNDRAKIIFGRTKPGFFDSQLRLELGYGLDKHDIFGAVYIEFWLGHRK